MAWLTVVVLASMVAAGLIFTKRKSTSHAPSGIASRFALEDQTRAYAAYGGSASCRECHVEAFEAWAISNHGLAERLPDATLDDPAFVPSSTFQHGTQQTSFRKSGGHFEMTAVGLKTNQEIIRVERVIGRAPLRQMLVPFPRGRIQASEAAWDPRSNEWFNVYGTEDRRPGEWGHWTGRGMNWNTMCATCHNTRLRKNYDASNDVFRTAMVETGVGCESCHGPMKAHNHWQHANKGRGLADPTIVKLSRDQMFDTCAACHSRRSEITGDPKPGENFSDHHLLAIVDESDVFYPDGQVREEDYEVSAFLGSRMFHKGVRCVDCHDPHTAKVRVPGNLMCLSCHAPGQTNGAPVINPATHSRHKVFGFDTNGVMLAFDLSGYKADAIKETGGECVNCHMPQTVYMQRHSRHDHGFTIPDPLLTKQFGTPNACNRCHHGKDTGWALKYVEEWYGDKMNRASRQRAQTIARARNGDDESAALLKMLQTDEQGYWRAVAARLLEHWAGQPPVSAALVGKLSDTNALVRQSIVQTLAALGDSASPEIHEALTERLDDPSRNVRVVAAQALASALNPDSLAGSELLHMLDHNADQPAGQMQLGLFKLARGDAPGALRHFRTAADWDPYSPGIRHEIAVVLSQMGRPVDALAELQEAVRVAPQDAESHFKLALAWNDLGQTTKALAELEEAVKLDPRNARAGYNLALARNAAGHPLAAIQSLLAAENADPQDPRIPYARATIHARLGQLKEARQAASRALELNPSFTAAATLLQQLQSGL